MLKRFAALFFILILAGSALAGICDCFDGSTHSASSCCKGAKSETTAISSKPCCAPDCGQSVLVSVHRKQSDSAVKIPLPPEGEPDNQLFLDNFFWRGYRTFIADKRIREIRPNLPRPPNLYIKHRSFLI
jgi:hypothetical protein